MRKGQAIGASPRSVPGYSDTTILKKLQKQKLSTTHKKVGIARSSTAG